MSLSKVRSSWAPMQWRLTITESGGVFDEQGYGRARVGALPRSQTPPFRAGQFEGCGRPRNDGPQRCVLVMNREQLQGPKPRHDGWTCDSVYVKVSGGRLDESKKRSWAGGPGFRAVAVWGWVAPAGLDDRRRCRQAGGCGSLRWWPAFRR